MPPSDDIKRETASRPPAAIEDYPLICRLLPRCDAIMSFKPIISSIAEDPAEGLARLGSVLVEGGAIDRRTLERAGRVAAETGAGSTVLTQLGLVSERGLAEALAQLLGAPVVAVGLPGYATLSRSAQSQVPAQSACVADRRQAACYPGHGRSARPVSPPPSRPRSVSPWRSQSPCRSSSRRRSTALRRCRQDAATARPLEKRRPSRAGGRGCRAAEGSRQRGAGDPAGQPDHRPRGRDPRLGHPYRAVRRPAARALSL